MKREGSGREGGRERETENTLNFLNDDNVSRNEITALLAGTDNLAKYSLMITKTWESDDNCNIFNYSLGVNRLPGYTTELRIDAASKSQTRRCKSFQLWEDDKMLDKW